MLRILFLVLVFTCTPAVGVPIHYDYDFNYYDISECQINCAPVARQGFGQLVVETDSFSIQQLLLTSSDFDVRWTGSKVFEVYDRWNAPGGSLVSLGTDLSLTDYASSLFLDLFFVPDAGNPMNYFENAFEHHNVVKNADSKWALLGRFTKTEIATVPEPASGLIFGLGMLVLGLLNSRRAQSQSSINQPA